MNHHLCMFADLLLTGRQIKKPLSTRALAKTSLHFFWWVGRAGMNALLSHSPSGHCWPAHGGSHCCVSSLTTSVNTDLNNKQKTRVSAHSRSARSPNDFVKRSVRWSANSFIIRCPWSRRMKSLMWDFLLWENVAIYIFFCNLSTGRLDLDLFPQN